MNADAGAQAELDRLRLEIEDLDVRLVALIAERVRLARQVGQLKRAAGLPTLDPAREASVVRRASGLAREAGLVSEEMREIIWHVIGLCRRAQAEQP
jgi:chorismate mutase